MIEFRLADTFTDRLAKLQSDEHKAAKSNGENSGKAKDKFEKLSRQANDIDGLDNPYKVIISG